MMEKRQTRRVWCCCLTIVTMHMLCWVSVGSSRLLTTHDALAANAPPPQHQQQHQVAQLEEEVMGVSSRLGSRPPSCEYKCRGCVPCDAIQIPTNTDRFTLQYANYEPEGWKCKCGPSFFNP